MTRILLTPGPLTTSRNVKQSMLEDMGTRDSDYQKLVQETREKMLVLADADAAEYTTVFLQGSGTYGVESVLTSVIKAQEKVLILSNGAYGNRMKEICEKAKIPHEACSYSMIQALPLEEIEKEIARKDVTHVAYIHCETTAGVMNDIEAIQSLIHKYHKISIVDAMSSFAGLSMSVGKLGIDYLITSSNKCLHGVPGIAIILARKAHLATCKNVCSSLSLDLYAQYRYMEEQGGSFRFTSPTHVMLALHTAIEELMASGGIAARHVDYVEKQRVICDAMKQHGFETIVPSAQQCPVITTFLCKDGFDFQDFYAYFKQHDILLYSGKLPGYDAFRIGNIGAITMEDVARFIALLDAYFKTGERA